MFRHSSTIRANISAVAPTSIGTCRARPICFPTFETEDPALGTSINRISAAGAKDVERAAIAARRAFVGRAGYLCVLCG